MKKRLLCLTLSLLLALSLFTGCNVQVSLDPDNPQISIELPELGEDISLDLSPDETNPPVSQSNTEDLNSLPAYAGDPYISVHGNMPFFTEQEVSDRSFEFYSELDRLGRCGVTIASIGRDLMPTEKRESIQQIHPSGWHQNQYDWVDGESLYNRCHLIGFQLAGENANEKNLITGTRYLNIEGMLPFENMVADYVKETGNHVMYRVTPIFQGNNLVADGVLMEGLSVEDMGEGITFCVYAYNVQPGVVIDYATGENWADKQEQPQEHSSSQVQQYILNTNSKKFHDPSCGGVEEISRSNRKTFVGTRDELIHKGYKPCGRCKP